MIFICLKCIFRSTNIWLSCILITKKNELQFLKVLLLQTGMITCTFIFCKMESKHFVQQLCNKVIISMFFSFFADPEFVRHCSTWKHYRYLCLYGIFRQWGALYSSFSQSLGTRLTDSKLLINVTVICWQGNGNANDTLKVAVTTKNTRMSNRSANTKMV